MNIKDLALKSGFSDAKEFSPKLITCKQELRDLCKTCKAYASSWICPPNCPDIASMQKKVDSFTSGMLFTSRHRADAYDSALTLKLGHEHSLRMFETAKHIPGSFVLTAGNCQLCETCSCPDEPCRHSELDFGSISAYGIDIIALCNEIGVNVSFKADEVTFIGIILW